MEDVNGFLGGAVLLPASGFVRCEAAAGRAGGVFLRDEVLPNSLLNGLDAGSALLPDLVSANGDAFNPLPSLEVVRRSANDRRLPALEVPDWTGRSTADGLRTAAGLGN